MFVELHDFITKFGKNQFDLNVTIRVSEPGKLALIIVPKMKDIESLEIAFPPLTIKDTPENLANNFKDIIKKALADVPDMAAELIEYNKSVKAMLEKTKKDLAKKGTNDKKKGSSKEDDVQEEEEETGNLFENKEEKAPASTVKRETKTKKDPETNPKVPIGEAIVPNKDFDLEPAGQEEVAPEKPEVNPDEQW